MNERGCRPRKSLSLKRQPLFAAFISMICVLLPKTTERQYLLLVFIAGHEVHIAVRGSYLSTDERQDAPSQPPTQQMRPSYAQIPKQLLRVPIGVMADHVLAAGLQYSPVVKSLDPSYLYVWEKIKKTQKWRLFLVTFGKGLFQPLAFMLQKQGHQANFLNKVCDP